MMTITLRRNKGAPLTISEVDNNFSELLQRVEQLEQSPPVQEQLTQIKQQGDELFFIGNLGNQLGRVQIPTLRLTPRGAWKTGCAYHINDLVTQIDTVYTCIKNHDSQTFEQDANYWSKMFEPFKTHLQPATAGQTNPMSPSTSTTSILPILNNATETPPTFGKLVIHVSNNTLEVLVGDIDCWRRVRDQSEFKFGA